MLEDKPISDEINEENQPVIQYLQHISDTATEDQLSLARIRQRLLRVSAGPLPVPRDEFAARERPLELLERVSGQQREGKRRFLRPIASVQEVWLPRLNILLAALLVLSLAGTAFVVLTGRGYVQPGQGPQQVGPFTLHSGWQEVRSFNGSGSNTFTGLDIRLPHVWGYALMCGGAGILNIEATGKDTQGKQLEWNAFAQAGGEFPSCGTSKKLLAPAALSFDLNEWTVQTLTVVAPAKVDWQLLIVSATQQPEPNLGSKWHVEEALDGAIPVDAPTTKYGKAIRFKTWGFIITCLGEGDATIVLYTENGLLLQDFPKKDKCDGQPRFYAQEYPVSGVQLQEIGAFVSVKSGFIWHAIILSCTDKEGCKTGPTGIAPAKQN